MLNNKQQVSFIANETVLHEWMQPVETETGLYRKKSSHRRVSSVYGHRERRESQEYM